MKKFSDLNIQVQDDKKIFEYKQVSITEIVNCPVVIWEYIPEMKTRHGDGRYLVHFESQGVHGKFFTNSKTIKSTLDAVRKSDYPFETIIKCVKIGQNSMYKLT